MAAALALGLGSSFIPATAVAEPSNPAPLTRAPIFGTELRLNDLLVKGTHNSFHRHPFVAIHPRHRYAHEPLRVQLEELGVRAFELDVHRSLFGEYQIYHIQVVDERSHCKRLLDCLSELRGWSDEHPDHEPLQIWIEAKDYAGGVGIESLRPLDSLLRTSLGDRLITPDDIRGDFDSLRDALDARGWPTLQESRGRMLFMLTANEPQTADYTSDYRHLNGRAMFVAGEPHQLHMPWVGVTKLNDPGDPLIATARAAGLLVTTTVCVPPLSDRACFEAKAAALASGAHVLLDDFPARTSNRAYHLDLRDTAIAGVQRP